MANNVKIPATGSGDATPTIASEGIGSTPVVQYQQMKLVDGTVGSTTPVDAGPGAPANGLRVVDATSSTPTSTNVSGTTTSTTLLAANASRAGATFFNDSTATLYLLLGSGTASATSFTVKIASGGYYELPYEYEGQVVGVWSAAAGAVRITELV